MIFLIYLLTQSLCCIRFKSIYLNCGDAETLNCSFNALESKRKFHHWFELLSNNVGHSPTNNKQLITIN